MPRPKRVEIYQAKESFVTHLNGEQIPVTKGDLVREGHEILKGREALFEPATGYIRFDVEDATAAPGAQRGE